MNDVFLKEPKTISTLKTGNLKIYEDNEVLKLVENSKFREEWDNLYSQCPWATIFQKKEFVATWYKTYQEQYYPLVIISEKEGELKGILCLAISRDFLPLRKNKSIKFTGAGYYDAEYQVWLSLPNEKDEFIESALNLLFQKYTKSTIVFRFIPSKIPIKLLKESSYWKPKMVVQPYHRPLIKMDHPDYPMMFKKRHFKAKLNRMKRNGDVQIKHITDKAQFSELINEVETQYDFRQGALFNKNQFKQDPQKKELLENLFDNGVLHVSVLKLDEKVIATIIGMEGGKWMHLAGLIVHCPFHSKLSPGLVQLFLLSKLLGDEGKDYFDLSPGDDAYKERIAFDSDEVYETTITNEPQYLVKRALRKKFHKKLLKVGYRPMDFQLKKERVRYFIREKGKILMDPRMLVKGIKHLIKKPQHKIVSIKPQSDFDISLHQDCLSDLLKFESKGTLLTRWEFLGLSLNAIENGKHAFTWSENNQLLASVWWDDEREEQKDDSKVEKLPVLKNLYIHPKVKNRKMEFISAVHYSLTNIFPLEAAQIFLETPLL